MIIEDRCSHGSYDKDGDDTNGQENDTSGCQCYHCNLMTHVSENRRVLNGCVVLPLCQNAMICNRYPISWPMPAIICRWTSKAPYHSPYFENTVFLRHKYSLHPIACQPKYVYVVLICGRILGPVATCVLTAPLYDNRMRTPTSAPVLPLYFGHFAFPEPNSKTI